MEDPDSQTHQLEYGEALRKAKTLRRCLPVAGVHWIEPGEQHSQCGKTATQKRPPDRPKE